MSAEKVLDRVGLVDFFSVVVPGLYMASALSLPFVPAAARSYAVKPPADDQGWFMVNAVIAHITVAGAFGILFAAYLLGSLARTVLVRRTDWFSGLLHTSLETVDLRMRCWIMGRAIAVSGLLLIVCWIHWDWFWGIFGAMTGFPIALALGRWVASYCCKCEREEASFPYDAYLRECHQAVQSYYEKNNPPKSDLVLPAGLQAGVSGSVHGPPQTDANVALFNFWKAAICTTPEALYGRTQSAEARVRMISGMIVATMVAMIVCLVQSIVVKFTFQPAAAGFAASFFLLSLFLWFLRDARKEEARDTYFAYLTRCKWFSFGDVPEKETKP